MQRQEEKQRKRKGKHIFGHINAAADAVIGVLRFDICLDLWFNIYGHGLSGFCVPPSQKDCEMLSK